MRYAGGLARSRRSDEEDRREPVHVATVVTGGDRAVTGKTKPGFPGEPHSERKVAVEPFAATLEKHGISLVRGEVHTLQVNTGLLCNLRCRHCHLEAGPDRREVMSRETMSAVIAFAERFRFHAIDITGGAPEMVPDLSFLIEGLAPLAPRLMLRTNLAALAAPAREGLLALCIARQVVLVASFPSTNPSQTDAQRGTGAAKEGVAMLRRLNSAGYGVDGSGLELNLVSNPVGAFLPATQAQAEARFRRDLLRKWGITFNNLYTFGNVPWGASGSGSRIRGTTTGICGLSRTASTLALWKDSCAGPSCPSRGTGTCTTVTSIWRRIGTWKDGRRTFRKFVGCRHPGHRLRSGSTVTPARRAPASPEGARYRPRRGRTPKIGRCLRNCPEKFISDGLIPNPSPPLPSIGQTPIRN